MTHGFALNEVANTAHQQGVRLSKGGQLEEARTAYAEALSHLEPVPEKPEDILQRARILRDLGFVSTREAILMDDAGEAWECINEALQIMGEGHEVGVDLPIEDAGSLALTKVLLRKGSDLKDADRAYLLAEHGATYSVIARTHMLSDVLLVDIEHVERMDASVSFMRAVRSLRNGSNRYYEASNFANYALELALHEQKASAAWKVMEAVQAAVRDSVHLSFKGRFGIEVEVNFGRNNVRGLMAAVSRIPALRSPDAVRRFVLKTP